MDKQELASYLASLTTILKDQDAAGANLRSQALGQEYEWAWGEFKRVVKEEKDARERDEGAEAGTSGEGSQPESGGPDREPGEQSDGSPDAVRRPRI